MISTPYHQGSAIVGWMPCMNGSEPRDVQSISAYHGIVLSASKQDSCSLTIPYLSPEDWMDTQSITNTSAEHAYVYFTPLNTLLTTSTSVAAAIPVEVWGTLESVDLSGFQSQSGKMGALDSNGLNAAQRAMKKQDDEAAAKAREGKDAAVGSVVRNTSQIVRRIPVVGGVWSVIADGINAIFGTELDKPLSTQANHPVIPQYFNDINHAAGITDATSLSLYQHPKMKVSPNMFGMDTSYKTFKTFCGQPMLYDTVVFNGSTTIWSTQISPLNIGVGFTTNYPDYLAIAATNFKYWRGSIKFSIYFCMPAFYSFRARIRVQWSSSLVDVGNVPSQQIDVKGDTWVDFIVPYLNWRTWFDQQASNNLIPTLYIEQLTTIVGAPSPSTAVAYVNIFRAGGEDTQFAVLLPAAQNALNIKRAQTSRKDEDLSLFQKQCSLKERFSKTFDGITPGQSMSQEVGMAMSEVVDSVNDMFKRGVEYAAIQAPGDQSGRVTFHSIIASSFMWRRGSIIVRHVHKGNTTSNGDGFYLAVASAPFRIDQGWSPASTTATTAPLQEAISLPWYCAAPYCVGAGLSRLYVGSAHTKALPLTVTLSLVTFDTITVSGGDDFHMLMQVPWANQEIATLLKAHEQHRRFEKHRASNTNSSTSNT